MKKEKPIVLSCILGGGRGSRLYSLTKDRAKPAVPILKYRLIDFPLSNCAISDIDFVFIIVQYEPDSLIEHCDPHHWGYNGSNLKIFGPNQTRLKDVGPIAGTAAAIRDVKRKINNVNPDVVLILSGDHIYHEDYTDVIDRHILDKADLTVYTKAVPLNKLSDFGAMRVNNEGRVIEFKEKPKDKETIEKFKLSEAAKKELGIDSDEDLALASMGMYVYDPKSMWRQIKLGGDDFGHSIIPRMVKDKKCKVMTNVFEGYWEDVGQLESLIEVNLDSIHNLDKMINPVYVKTNPRPNLRPAKGSQDNAIVCEGSVIDGTIENCVIGYQTIVEHDAVLKNTIIFGGDRHLERRNKKIIQKNYSVIGQRSYLNNIVLDRNIKIPHDVELDGSLPPDVIRRALSDIGLKENNKDNPYGEYNITKNKFLVIGKPWNMGKFGGESFFPEGFKIKDYL